ncbi:MAG: hypothetical protein E7312_03690 [Clostridiales bacterium]|nr:hypothetical protein [Clostridiales bacterium]
MKVTLIYGCEGSGKSSLIYDIMKENRTQGSQSVFIVPDQYTHQTELDIINALGASGLSDTDVFSFKRLSHRLKLFYGGASVILMSDDGKNMLVNSIINRIRSPEDEALLKNSAQTDISSDMSRLISRLKQNNVTPEQLENCAIDENRYSHTKQKLIEVAKVLREYENVCAGFNKDAYIDNEDDMALLCKNISESGMFKNTDVYIDGFDDLIKPELEVVRALIMSAKSVTFVMPCRMNQQLNRGLLFYRQLKLTNAIERIVNECSIAPIKINIAPDSQKGRGEDIFIPYRSKRCDELTHLEANIFSTPVEYPYVTDNITVTSYQTIQDEVARTLDTIASLVRENGYRYNDIALVCSDIEKYSKYLQKAFEKRSIPYFMDIKREISSNSIVGFVLGLLDALCRDSSTDAIISAFKTGLLVNPYNSDGDLPLSFEELSYLEKYARAYKVRFGDWSDGFKYGSKYYDLERLNETRQKIMEYYRAFKALVGQSSTASEFANSIVQFLNDKGIVDIVDVKITELINDGKAELASEYSSIKNLLFEIFEQIKEFMGNTPINIDEFTQLLRSTLSNAKVNVIPVCIDQLTVLDRSRTMAKHVKVLVVLGAGDIGIADESGIFNSTELELLSNASIDIGADKNNTIGDVQYYIYKILSKPTDKLYISYVKPESGQEGNMIMLDAVMNCFGGSLEATKGRTAQYLLGEADNIANAEEAMLFRQCIVDNKDIDKAEIDKLDAWLRQNGSKRYNILSDTVQKGVDHVANSVDISIDSDVMLKKEKGIYNVDASRLERYVRCPYSYFVRYCLNVKPDGDAKVSAIDVGNIVHTMLEGFVKDILNRDDVDAFDIRQYAHKRFAIIWEEYENGIIALTNENRYLLSRLRDILSSLMVSMYNNKGTSSTVFYAAELPFDDKFRHGLNSVKCIDQTGCPFNITGKIDLVEYAEIDGKKYWIVNDYKTGNKPKPGEIVNSKSLQLPLYMIALVEGTNDESLPGAMFYVNVNDNVVQRDGSVDESVQILRRYGRTGLVTDDHDLMGAIDNSAFNAKEAYDLTCSNTIYNKQLLSKKDEEDMLAVLRDARAKACEIFSDIRSGRIAKEPALSSECTRCEYRRFCGFEKRYSVDDEEED